MPTSTNSSVGAPHAPLTVWLATQCQLIHGVIQAQLHRAPDWRCVAMYPAHAQAHSVSDLLNKVIERGQFQLRPSDNGLHVGYPIKRKGTLWGVLVFELREGDQRRLPECIQQLKLGQFWLECLLRKTSGTTVTPYDASEAMLPDSAMATSALTLLHLALKEPTLAEVGISLANQLASLMGAVRVSIGWRHGNTIDLQAVSFSAHFDRRTDAMQRVEHVLHESLQQGVPVHRRATDTSDNPARDALLSSHYQLLQEQHLKAIYTFPLRTDQHIVGAMCIELHKRDALTPSQDQLLQHVLGDVARVIECRRQADVGVWQGVKQRMQKRLARWFGKDEWRGRVTAGVVIALLGIMWVSIEYRPSMAATLEADSVYWVVAPHDGFLGDVKVRPGDTVTDDAVLAQMQDDDLRLERRKVSSMAQQSQQAYDAALANGQRVEAAIARAQWEQARIQLQLLDQQLKRTQLVAPMAGVIVSDDMTQRQGAPVTQGDVLFEIAASDQYRLDIFVDEQYLSAIYEGQAGYFQLSSWPDHPLRLTIKAITPQSEIRDSRNVFRVEAQIESADVQARLRPGMTGTARIDFGRRAIGWILFHDMWHWWRRWTL
jgi:multidrug resistance efflux pump